jgi:type IV pilus assembly protein PilA
MSITTALKARREALADREAGFTLIELLVVVLIIGILAAIAIPVYLGVQNNAKDSSVKSDLVNIKTALTAVSADNAGAPVTGVTQSTTTPYTATAALSGVTGAKDLIALGWSKSPTTTNLVFTAGTGANLGKWCVLATSATSKKFLMTSTGPVTETPAATTTCTAA